MFSFQVVVHLKLGSDENCSSLRNRNLEFESDFDAAFHFHRHFRMALGKGF